MRRSMIAECIDSVQLVTKNPDFCIFALGFIAEVLFRVKAATNHFLNS